MKSFTVFFPPLHPDVQAVCGLSCEDIASMFKELRGLGVVVKKLSIDLRKVVSSTRDCPLPLFPPSLHLSLCFQLKYPPCVTTCHCNSSLWPKP